MTHKTHQDLVNAVKVAHAREHHFVRSMQEQRAERPQTQMDLMMRANALSGSTEPVAHRTTMNDPNSPTTLGAIHVRPQRPAVQSAPLAPHVQSTPCGPGQVLLTGGKCGHVTPPAPSKQCGDNQAQIGQMCIDLPPPPSGSSNAILLAQKAVDTSGQPALRFFAHADAPKAPGSTRGILVWNGSAWAPTKMDQTFLSTLFIVAGSVPAGMMLAVSNLADGSNQVSLVAANNVAKRAVVNSVAGLGAPKQKPVMAPHRTGAVKPILNAARAKAKGPIRPLGAGMREFHMPRKAVKPAQKRMGVGAPATKLCSYITKRGDTLQSIAAAHGLHPKMLSSMNPAVILAYSTPMSGGFRMNVPCRG